MAQRKGGMEWEEGMRGENKNVEKKVVPPLSKNIYRNRLQFLFEGRIGREAGY